MRSVSHEFQYIQYLRDDNCKMEDMHVQDDVKDEVTLLESNRKCLLTENSNP